MIRSVLAGALLLAVTACGGDRDEALPVDGAGLDTGAPDAPTDAATPSKRCGGFVGETCDPDQFCDFPGNTCGVSDEQGECKPRPVGCPDVLVFEPNCGCDGTVYGSECDVYAAGSDRNAAGTGPVPGGSFACGYTQCNLFNQYCVREVSDIGGEPDVFRCQALPGCPSQFPTCGCLASEPCGAFCTGQGTTGLTLTCPGG